MVEAVGQENLAGFASRRPDCQKRWGIPVFDLLNGLRGRLSTGLARRFGTAGFAEKVEAWHLNNVVSRAIEQVQPTIIFVQFVNMAAPISKTLGNFAGRVFVHCHGVDVTWDLGSSSRPTGPFSVGSPTYPSSVKTLAPFTTFIANSQWTISQLTQIGIPTEKISLKHLGVTVPELPARNETDTVSVLYVGRLIDFKGPDLCIEAFEKLADRCSNVQFTIAGDGPMMDRCRELVNKSRHRTKIRLLGSLPFEQVQELMKSADVFTAHNQKGPQTNQFEAFGVSIIEAMAHGIPVVTGRSGGPCETVVDGQTGFLFEPGDVDAHAESLARLVENQQLRQEMGAAARQRVMENFTSEHESLALRQILGLRNEPLPVHHANSD